MANTPTPANSLNPQAQAPNPLDQLRDIHLPEPISWWPPAPGWWILAVASCALLAWILKYLHQPLSRQALSPSGPGAAATAAGNKSLTGNPKSKFEHCLYC